MKGLKELIVKKMKSGEMSDEKGLESKSSILDELEGLADEGIAESMKKVTVAAPDSESLEEGLEMAKDKIPQMDKMAKDIEEGYEDAEKGPEEDDYESEMEEDMEDMDIEELEALLADLKRKKGKSKESEEYSEEM